MDRTEGLPGSSLGPTALDGPETPALNSTKDPSGEDPKRRLVESNLGWLRGWVRGRIRDPEVVHDVCQDAFVKALKSWDELKDPAKFPAWLYRIAENTLRDHIRGTKRRRRRFAEVEDLDQVAAPAVSADPVGVQEEADRVLAKLDGLPRPYREPLLLRHAQDLSYAEIGRILGLTENAVQVRIFRARKMLREALDRGARDGGSHEA